MRKHDEIDELYRQSGIWSKAGTVLFVLDICLSVVLLILPECGSIIVTGQIAVALLFFLVRMIDDSLFWYEAEKQRRKDNIQSAFNVKLSSYGTVGYYNNTIDVPISKYGVNTLESNFFSKFIAGRMLYISFVKVAFVIVAFIIVFTYDDAVSFALIVAQTLLSSYVLEETVLLIVYKIRMDDIYDEAYKMMLQDNVELKELEAYILSYVLEYESIKSHCKVRLSKRIFEKYNPTLSQKWSSIAEQIKKNSVK